LKVIVAAWSNIVTHGLRRPPGRFEPETLKLINRLLLSPVDSLRLSPLCFRLPII